MDSLKKNEDENKNEEVRELEGDEFLINIIDIGFQRIESIFEFWIELLTVGYKGSIASIFRFAKIGNRIELDIFFYSFSLEIFRIEGTKEE